MAKPAQRASGSEGASGLRGGAQQRLGMPSDSKDILAEAKRRAQEAWDAEHVNIIEMRDCQRFYAGGKAQWDEKAYNSRTLKGRPVVTINRLPQFARQVTGEIRKNPPAIKVSPAKGNASQSTADTYGGIIRQIERLSNATDCYVKAAENVVQTGVGYFRVAVDYSSDDGFEQDIRILQIRDPGGALLDPFRELPDGSDMRYGFVFENMSLHDYQDEFPGKAVVSVDEAQEGWQSAAFPWRVSDTVRIAEYWRRIPVKKQLFLMPDGSVLDGAQITKMPQEVQDVITQGVEAGEIQTRDVDDCKVEMYRISGSDVLDGPHEWAGRYIPICMVSGEEITMGGSTVRKGLVHDARDPQRILNYANSINVEAIALQPKAPFVATVEQIKGYEKTWKTAGSDNHSVLVYNGDPRANGPPSRVPPALASQGIAELMLQSSQNLKDVTGIQDASLGTQSNETSGIAIANRQREGDTSTYFFVDNLRRAIGYAGKILVDLIPHVYDSVRQVAILQEDGTSDMVSVVGKAGLGEWKPPPVGDGKKPVTVHNLADGEYTVAVSTGPSFATQRAEAAANMIEVFRAQPQLFQLAGDLLFKNLDFPGAMEFAKRIGKTIPAPLKDDNIEELPQSEPSPDVVAKVEKDMADAGKTKAETEKTQVETASLLVQLQADMAAIRQMLAGGAPMGGPPGLSPPGAPMPAPPPAPPMQPDMNGGAPPDAGLPPMVEAGDESLPPMVEVEGAPA